jgi:hypothetical protein
MVHDAMELGIPTKTKSVGKAGKWMVTEHNIENVINAKSIALFEQVFHCKRVNDENGDRFVFDSQQDYIWFILRWQQTIL